MLSGDQVSKRAAHAPKMHKMHLTNRMQHLLTYTETRLFIQYTECNTLQCRIHHLKSPNCKTHTSTFCNSSFKTTIINLKQGFLYGTTEVNCDSLHWIGILNQLYICLIIIQGTHFCILLVCVTPKSNQL